MASVKDDGKGSPNALANRNGYSRSAEIAPVAFHLRHIARSLDRLLTYAEGRQLTDDQLAQLKMELTSDSTH